MAAPTLPEQRSSFQPFQGILIKKKAVERIQNLCPNHQHVPNRGEIKGCFRFKYLHYCVSQRHGEECSLFV